MTNQKAAFLGAFKAWLPFAVIILVFSGLIYVTVQQNYRSSANDPQTQYAEDISYALSHGTTAADSIVPPNPTQDISQSLAPFVIIFTSSTTPVGSSVSIDGKLPTLPSGVFELAKKNGENRFTWQPKKDTRIAAVVKYFSGSVSGYVLAGRSLKEVEKRETQLCTMTVIAGALALALTYLVLLLIKMMCGPKEMVMMMKEEKIIEVEMTEPENKM